jgi:hypothetical protein
MTREKQCWIKELVDTVRNITGRNALVETRIMTLVERHEQLFPQNEHQR